MTERIDHETAPSPAVVQAAADLNKAEKTWQQLSQRRAELDAKGVHRSDAEVDELGRIERQLQDYPPHLEALRRAVALAVDTTILDQVTTAAPAYIAALVEDHQDFQRWMFEGIALAKRWRGDRGALAALLETLPPELHEKVAIGTAQEVIAQLPPLLQALLHDNAGWTLETTLAADKGAHDLPTDLYERYREELDLKRKRDASMRAAAEESGVVWTTVYEARSGRPVQMRSTDAAEALAIGHHVATPPAWATA